MGLGVHGGGLGVARFLADRGALVTVTDLRGPELLQPSLDALAGLPIRFVLVGMVAALIGISLALTLRDADQRARVDAPPAYTTTVQSSGQ